MRTLPRIELPNFMQINLLWKLYGYGGMSEFKKKRTKWLFYCKKKFNTKLKIFVSYDFILISEWSLTFILVNATVHFLVEVYSCNFSLQFLNKYATVLLIITQCLKCIMICPSNLTWYCLFLNIIFPTRFIFTLPILPCFDCEIKVNLKTSNNRKHCCFCGLKRVGSFLRLSSNSKLQVSLTINRFACMNCLKLFINLKEYCMIYLFLIYFAELTICVISLKLKKKIR